MKKLFLLLLAFLSWSVSFADNINFTVSAPRSVALGQQFRIEYAVNGDGKDLRTGDFKGFEVLMGPSTSSSMSTQIINGKVSSQTSKTFTYMLSAMEEGTFRIPAATIKVDGKQYVSEEVSIKVLPRDKTTNTQQNSSDEQSASVSSDDVLLLMQLSKTKVYENEVILATLKLLTVNPQTQFLNGKLPNFEGFTVQNIELPNQQSFELEHYNGRNYYAVVWQKTLLYPQHSGKIVIEPATMEVSIPVRTQRKMRSIFDDFFDGYQNVKKTISSGKKAIEVESLPFGKPATFLGGVGEFNVTSSISSQSTKANDAVTLKLVISGNGNLKYIKDPELKLPADFESFDPKIDLNIKTTSNGVVGNKTIEYTFIPRYPGDFDIPGVDFSYFDLKTKSYKTITTPNYSIHVEKGADNGNANGGVTNFSNTSQESLKVLGSDIRYIRTGNLLLKKTPKYYFNSLFMWLAYIIPFILFIVIFIIYRKQVKENANIAMMKNKKANKVALKRLKVASRYLKDHQKDQFYDEMLKAIWGYLSDKLSIPTSELTRDNVQSLLTEKGVDSSLIESFMSIIGDCEFARYAPAQNDAAMDELYMQTMSVIGKMESVIRK